MPLPCGLVEQALHTNVGTEPHARVANANTHDKHVAFAAYTVPMHG